MQPGRTTRLDLTGEGGGRYDVALAPGDPVGEPDIVLTVDVLDFCRVAARRLDWDQLDLTVEGERPLTRPVLVGASTFAAD